MSCCLLHPSPWRPYLCRTRFMAFAAATAFVTVVALVLGFSFESLTATRKIVPAGLVATRGILVIDATKLPVSVGMGPSSAALAAAASVWIVIRVPAQQTAQLAWLSTAAVLVFMALMVESCIRAIEGDPMRGASAGLTLGLCAGPPALLGASA